MRMIKYYSILLLLIFNFCIPSTIIDNTELRINSFFPDLLSLEWSLYSIEKKSLKSIQNTVKQKFFRNEVNTWIITDTDTSKYYAILDNVKGKSLPITFLAIFNEKGEIYNTSIIKYREAYGGEVGNKSWLNQFISFNDTSNYKVGNDISAISGATISVHSVSKGIRKLSILIKDIIKDYNER